jgi:tetratricopeptide (TPR) repeat protein
VHIGNNKAAALNLLGRYSESIGVLERLLEKGGRDVLYKNLGDAYCSIGIYEKAIINYERGIQMNSEMEEAYYNLAVCYYMQEHLSEGRNNIEAALRINPDNEEYVQLKK